MFKHSYYLAAAVMVAGAYMIYSAPTSAESMSLLVIQINNTAMLLFALSLTNGLSRLHNRAPAVRVRMWNRKKEVYRVLGLLATLVAAFAYSRNGLLILQTGEAMSQAYAQTVVSVFALTMASLWVVVAHVLYRSSDSASWSLSSSKHAAC